jgi:Zn-dependent protease with chaperone function
MFEGIYYNGRDSHPTQVTCEPSNDGTLGIRGGDVDTHIPLNQVHLNPRLARTHRTLALPNGAQIQSEDNDGIDAAFPDRNRLESFTDRLERHSYVVAISTVIIVIAGILLFRTALPWAADRVAQRIPVAAEKTIGDEALSTLQTYRVLRPSKTAIEQQENYRHRFSDFVRDIPGSANFRVQFFDAPSVGPNAFALPGGTIVFTDQLATLLKSDDQFIAIAAHEIGHEYHRHVLRSVLQQSAIAIVTAYFVGDVGSASTIVIAVPVFFLNNHYSRDFEADADAYAFKELAAHNISPRAFAEVMQLFDTEYPDDDSMAYLSSHPLNAERISRAEAAADAFEKTKR